MGKNRFSPHLRRFSRVPRTPCVYVVELHRPDGTLLKVGMGGNALGRMVSLHSESKREHDAAIGRFAIYTAPNYKAAYEAETRAVKALELIAAPIVGRREFFAGLTFETVCEIASAALGDRPCAFLGEEESEPSECGGVGVFHDRNGRFF